MPTLLVCKRVCTLWRATLLSSQRFRRLLFLQPPSDESADAGSGDMGSRAPVAVHPALLLLESDWAVPAAPIIFSSACPAAGQRLDRCAVKDNYATEPALSRFLVAVPGHGVEIRRRAGVRVWDVARGVKDLFGTMAADSKTAMFGESWWVLSLPPPQFRCVFCEPREYVRG